MAKTTQIQGKGYALLINGEIIKRAQSLDFGADLAVENILELANASFVERKADLPKVNLSFDLNEIGTMANLKLFKTGVQFTEGGAYGVSHDATGVFYPTYSGNDVVTMADPTFDFDHQLCPSAIIKVSEHNNTVIDRSVHIQGCYLDSVDFSYDVGGMAKESFKLSSDQKVWYFKGTNDNTDIDLEFPTGVDAFVAATQTIDTSLVDADDRIIAIYVNRNMIYNSESGIGTALAPNLTTPGKITVTTNVAVFATGDRIEVLYAHKTPRQFPKLNSTNTGTKGALRRGAIVISAYKAGDSATNMLRLQSVAGSLDMGRQERYELGTQRYIDKPATYPLNVRFDMTFLANDLEAMALWQGKHATGSVPNWTDGDLAYLDVKDFIDSCVVKVQIYSDEYDHSAAKLAKTITIQHCKVVTDGDTARIGNVAGEWRATVTADAITWSGSGNAID